MSDSYESGTQSAQVFISQWKKFDRKSLTIINEDLGKRRHKRRTFRLTNASKARFVAGIASVFLREPVFKLTRADYAQLSGINKGTLDKLIEKDQSLIEIVEGKEEKPGPGPLKRGPPGNLVFYVLRDVELKKMMKEDAEFLRGFLDEFVRWTTNDESTFSVNIEGLADEYRRSFGSKELLQAFKGYCEFLEDVKLRIKELCEQITDPKKHPEFNPEFNPVYRSTKPSCVLKGEKAIEFLSVLQDETRAAINNARRSGFDSRFARTVIRVDIPEIRSMWSDYLRIVLMLYFVSPWAADEFAKYI